MATQLQDGNTPYLVAAPSNPRPTVLVFDLGVSGLLVYDETRRLLPDPHYIYAFDNVAFPCGERSEEFIVERIVEIMIAVRQRYPLSFAATTCSTTSTVSFPTLRGKFAFLAVGVVPAIKPAARLTANGVVGLLATRATVKQLYTHELIARFANECQIAVLGSAKLVEPAKVKPYGETVSPEKLWRIPRPWLRMSEPPGTVALGRTHLPLLQEELLQVLPEGARLADSGVAIVRRTVRLSKHEVPDVESTDENVAFYMAMTTEAEQLLPVLWCYGFKALEKLSV